MSLTGLIKNNKSVQKLFDEKLGDIKSLFKTENGIEAFPRNLIAISPVPEDPLWNSSINASNVGMAYDFFFRAFLQRKNKKNEEEDLSEVIKYGLEEISVKMKLNPERKWNEVIRLENAVKNIWEYRNKYINGEDVKKEALLKGMLLLAYVENHYRYPGANLRKDYKEVNKIELKSLKELVENTETKYAQSFFTIKEMAEFNPDFGKYSNVVGGADADIVIDNTLIDFKTKKDVKYLKTEVYQIIGYYILDRFNKKGTNKKILERIGLYFSRHDHFVYLDTKDLEANVDIEKLGEEFFLIAEKEFGYLKNLQMKENRRPRKEIKNKQEKIEIKKAKETETKTEKKELSEEEVRNLKKSIEKNTKELWKKKKKKKRSRKR